MSLGGSHTCALLSDGAVWCWGSSEDGQLGDGTIGMGAHRPGPAPISGLAGVVNVAAGDAHTCAALSDGTARCWGHGGFGKLGDGAFMSVPVPQDVPGLVGVAGIALGQSHTCAWLADGGAKCWGMNQFGQLGTGSTADAPTPANVMSLPDAAGISLGSHHTCARREGGAAACWGDGYSGQLGDGTSGMGAQKLTPSPVPGLGDVAQVGVGHFMSCARTTAGDVSCWGSNLYGQLGIGNTQDQASPAPVGGLADAIWLAAGTFHVCALRSDGTVFCWGNAADGRLGNGMASGSQPAPEAVPGLGSMAGVAAGGAHTCAWSSIGQIFCWGNNDFGQLGDGTSGGSKATPVQVKWP
jgi:alpha-tubulin suppressor-like RCC1 family protein